MEEKQGCPECGSEPRLCIKAGPVYRRKTDTSPSAEIQAYICTKCGYKARGSKFNMTEVMRVEKEKATDIKIETVVTNDSN